MQDIQQAAERQIAKTAARIHSLQAMENQANVDLLKADGVAGYHWWHFNLNRAQGASTADLASLLREANVVEAEKNDLRAKVRQISDEIADAHIELSSYHRRHRRARVFGDRELPILVIPDPLKGDVAIANHDKILGAITEKRAAAGAKLTETTERLDETTGRLNVARVDVHRGLVTKVQLAQLERDRISLLEAAEALEAEVRDLDTARRSVQNEREQRADVLNTNAVPMLRAEEARRLQGFANALRDVAVAATGCYQVIDALGRAGVPVAAYPFPILRIDEDFSVETPVIKWLLDAIETGVIE